MGVREGVPAEPFCSFQPVRALSACFLLGRTPCSRDRVWSGAGHLGGIPQMT